MAETITPTELKKLLDSLQSANSNFSTFIPLPLNQPIGTLAGPQTPPESIIHKHPLVGLEGKYFFSMKDWIDGI